MTQEECQNQLTEARAAMQKILTGQQVVEMWHDDQRVRYSAANKADLAQYIARLEAQCGSCRQRGRSVGMVF